MLKRQVENIDHAVEIQSIDTLKLAKTMKESLKNAKISRDKFATQVLGITFSSLTNQLYRSKPWAQCCDKWKQSYQIMHEWLRSSETLKALTSKDENTLDTIKLTDEAKKLLNDSKITYRVFAKEVLGISRYALENMIYNPKQWTQCPSEWKKRYHKMNEWIKSSPEESIILLKTLSSKNDIDDDKRDANIDTVKLVNEIKSKLKEEKIPHWLFAKNVLEIPTPSFSFLLLKPKPYEKSLEKTKELYRKMNEWLKSPKESIEAMKMLTNKLDGEVELDTHDLIERVNKLSARLQITKSKISSVLDISYNVLLKLLHQPVPWRLLTKLKKEYYTKIHDWLLQKENENESD
jgi:hypothetical protein